MWARAGACALAGTLLAATGCTQDFEEFIIAAPAAGDEGGGGDAATGEIPSTGAAGGSGAMGSEATSASTYAGASSSASASSSGAGGAPPIGDRCPGPVIDLMLGAPQTIRGDTTGASNDAGDPLCGGTQSGELVYQIHVLSDGDFWAVADGAYQTLLYVREGCPGTTVHQACGTFPGPSELELYVEAGETFFLFVDGYGVLPEEGPFQLSLSIE